MNLSLENREWKAFKLINIFPKIQRGKRLRKADHIQGQKPYVSSSGINNGVDNFISNEDNVRIFSNCLTLANSGSVGATFYHSYSFVASDHVTKLENKKFNKYIYLFIANLTSRYAEKYGFNREINDLRIRKEKVLLPATPNGEPDYAFMEAYMRAKEAELLKRYKSHISLKIMELGGGGVRRNVRWKAFLFPDVFEIKNGFYNKKPVPSGKGVIPFLGATQANNGITEFYTLEEIKNNSKTGKGKNESIERKLFKGNCIAVTNNGSVGFAYYQIADFTCSHDINPLYLKEKTLNSYIAKFLITAIEQQKVCFEYARKWRPMRMKKSQILLPVNDKNEPDYEYMEQYMKNLEAKQLEKYYENKLKEV